MRWTGVLLLASAMAIGGCNGRSSESSQAEVRASTPAQPATQTVGAPAGGPLAETPESPPVPSEREIKAKQAERSTPTPSPTPNERTMELSKAREVRVKPDKLTAPASALPVAERAAREWLAFKVDGTEPDDGSVIPGKLTKGIAPLSPDLRMQGAARLQDLVAFAAHPQNGGWIIVVSTKDGRMPTIAVDLERDGDGFAVRRVFAS